MAVAEPHRDSDIGMLECRRVVDAVAGHRRHLTVPLQGAHESQLVLGIDPGEHVDLGGYVGELVVVHVGDLGAGDDATTRLDDVEFCGDPGGGARVVTGDHDHPDPAVVRLLHSGSSFGPGRVAVVTAETDGCRVFVDRGHQLAVGVERDLSDSPERLIAIVTVAEQTLRLSSGMIRSTDIAHSTAGFNVTVRIEVAPDGNRN